MSRVSKFTSHSFYAAQNSQEFLFMSDNTYEQVKYTQRPGVIMTLKKLSQRFSSGSGGGSVASQSLVVRVRPSPWLHETMFNRGDASFVPFEQEKIAPQFDMDEEELGTYLIKVPQSSQAPSSSTITTALGVIDALSLAEEEKDHLFVAYMAVLTNGGTATFVCSDTDWAFGSEAFAQLQDLLDSGGVLRFAPASALLVRYNETPEYED